MAPIDRSHTCFYSSSIVTMVMYCIVFEIKPDIGRKMPIFHTALVFNLHDPLNPLQIYAWNFNTNCPSPWAIRRCKDIAKKFKSLHRVQRGYRQTDNRWTAHAI